MKYLKIGELFIFLFEGFKSSGIAIDNWGYLSISKEGKIYKGYFKNIIIIESSGQISTTSLLNNSIIISNLKYYLREKQIDLIF